MIIMQIIEAMEISTQEKEEDGEDNDTDGN